MKKPRDVAGALVLFFGAFFIAAQAEVSPTVQPFPGITCYSETRTTPPTRLWVVTIDLKNPKVHIRSAPGGPDPDGPGPWQTTLMPPTQIAEREHFDLVINADFFSVDQVKDGEGALSRYRAGQSASVVGTAVTDGKAWSIGRAPQPSLVIHKNRRVTIEPVAKPPADDWEVVSGNTMLVKDGVSVVPVDNKALHPRTVVGLDATGTKLTILIVDGRKPGIADGMTYEDLAHEMLKLGCSQALNLDGGGSTILGIRDATTGEMKILNAPTDGMERAVAEALGVTVDR